MPTPAATGARNMPSTKRSSYMRTSAHWTRRARTDKLTCRRPLRDLAPRKCYGGRSGATHSSAGYFDPLMQEPARRGIGGHRKGGALRHRPVLKPRRQPTDPPVHVGARVQHEVDAPFGTLVLNG